MPVYIAEKCKTLNLGGLEKLIQCSQRPKYEESLRISRDQVPSFLVRFEIKASHYPIQTLTIRRQSDLFAPGIGSIVIFAINKIAVYGIKIEACLVLTIHIAGNGFDSKQVRFVGDVTAENQHIILYRFRFSFAGAGSRFVNLVIVVRKASETVINGAVNTRGNRCGKTQDPDPVIQRQEGLAAAPKSTRRHQCRQVLFFVRVGDFGLDSQFIHRLITRTEPIGLVETPAISAYGIDVLDYGRRFFD